MAEVPPPCPGCGGTVHKPLPLSRRDRLQRVFEAYRTPLSAVLVAFPAPACITNAHSTRQSLAGTAFPAEPVV